MTRDYAASDLAERIMTDLRAVGIRVNRLEQMERAAFIEKVDQGDQGFAPGGLLLNASGAPGDAVVRIREFAVCEGTRSRIWFLEEIDAKFQRYEQSVDPAERQLLLNEIQRFILDRSPTSGMKSSDTWGHSKMSG